MQSSARADPEPSVRKHRAHLLRCLAWHPSCDMASDWPGSPTTAHVSSESTDQEHVFFLFNSCFLLQKWERKQPHYHFVHSLPCYLIDSHSTTLSSVGLHFLRPGLITPGPPDMHFPRQILFMSLSSGHAKCIPLSCAPSQLFLRTLLYLGDAFGLICP